MSSERKKYFDQLYCLIVSQLLNDGYTSIAKSLNTICNLDQYGRILASNELFDVVFADEAFGSEAGYSNVESDLKNDDKPEMPNSLESSIGKKATGNELTNAQIEEVASGESIPSNTVLKKVKMKKRFTHQEDHHTVAIEWDTPALVSKDSSEVHGSPFGLNTCVTTESIIAFPTDCNLLQNEKLDSTFKGAPGEEQLHVVETDDVDNNLHKRSSKNKSSSKLCCYCNTQEANLSKHILENHATRCGRGFKCNICGILIQKKLYNLNEHLKTHNDAKHFLCSDCGIGFKRAAARRDHMETVHANYIFECGICRKVCKSKTAFRAHQYTHTKEYSLPCGTCGKCFRYSRDLANHELTHTGAKPHQCSVCQKEFRTQSQVLRHVKQQHGSSIVYKCGLCPYRVIQKCNLKIHMKRHTGVKYGELFICSLCFCGFPTLHLLDEHDTNECSKMTSF